MLQIPQLVERGAYSRNPNLEQDAFTRVVDSTSRNYQKPLVTEQTWNANQADTIYLRTDTEGFKTYVAYHFEVKLPEDLRFSQRQYHKLAEFFDYHARMFQTLARTWTVETGYWSVIAKRYRHPAYKAILKMGEPVIPLILQELRKRPDRWFAALEELTGENPAKDAVNFYEAVDRWVSWGIANEYLDEENVKLPP